MNTKNCYRLFAAAATLISIVILSGCKSEDSSTSGKPKGHRNDPPRLTSNGSDDNKDMGFQMQGDPAYGPVDTQGFPTNPNFAMNSNKIDDEQRSALRDSPPRGYQVVTQSAPRFANHRDGGIAWRETEAPRNLAICFASSGSKISIPEGLFPDDEVILSPSGNRMLIVDGSMDRGRLFERRSSGWDVGQSRRVRSVTFDDPWRWFISWSGFMTESLIVGLSITDDEIEKHPEQRLYTYDIDAMKLTRIRLPSVIQPKGVFESYQIEAVSSAAILLRLSYKEGRKDDLFTVYLNPNELPGKEATQ